MTTRGIRNNNPGNIDFHASIPWAGLANPPTDGRFCWFVAPVWGLRAIARQLVAYQQLHGCRSVRAMISRWAPPNENATDAYVQHVADVVGVGADDDVDVHDPDVMDGMIRAIVSQENGAQPYPDDLIREAMLAAGIGEQASRPPT